MAKRSLYDVETQSEYSANLGDYWNYPKDYVFKNDSGDNLWLLENGKVKKKLVKVSDLKDNIYESQKYGRAIFNKRKSVGRNRVFEIKTENSSYIVDSKGRMTNPNEYYEKRDKAFSGNWLFDGVDNMYLQKEFDWDSVLENPDWIKIKKRGGFYVRDIDNGTSRVIGKIVSVREIPKWARK